MHPKILIDYIEQNGLDILSDQLKVDVKYHPHHPNLVMLKYRQIEADFNNPLVRLCRGIILDRDDNWRVVNYTYYKFLNYGQGNADQINWSTAKVQEKVDGSLCQLYWYDGKWNVATSGMPAADGLVGDFGFTFAELFWRVGNELGYVKPQETTHCFAFELLSSYNQVVIQHPTNRIVLHGVRDLTTFQELAPTPIAARYGWECVKSFPLNTLEAVVEMAKGMDGTKQEGFVVCDANYNRIKLKCANYVSLAHLRNSCGASKRQMLEIIRRGESEEFLTYFPTLANDFYGVKEKYEALVKEVANYYQAIQHIIGPKEFAAQATKKKFSGLLFGMHQGKLVSFKAGLAEMHIKHLENWLGMKEEHEA